MNPSNYNLPLIFFTKGKGFWEKSIMEYTKFVYRMKGIKLEDTYSHVSMVLPTDFGGYFVIETNPKLGVRYKVFKDSPNRFYKQSINPISKVNALEISELIFEEVKELFLADLPYNYLGAASQIINMPTGIFLGKKQRMDKVYCSQFIAYILYKYFRFEEFKNYNTISIVDLQLSDRFKNI